MNNIFIDGIVFGEMTFGGVARMWQEIIPRIHSRGVPMTLLMPVRNNFPTVKSLHGHINIVNDYFYWPKRVFDRDGLRSRLLTQFYGASDARVFHSTYFTTIDAAHTEKFVTVYDMIYEIFDSINPSKWVKQVLHNKRKSIENADKIICISENTKQDLLKLFPSTLEEKIAVIYPGVTTLSLNKEYISVSEIAAKYRCKIISQGYFLVVGRLDGYKNFQVIIDLLHQNHNARNFRFLCIGGEKTSTVRSIATSYYPENFIFVDFATDEELIVLYRNAIGLVYPSRYEGFGIPIVEAMSQLCPVVCSSSSSLPEAGGEAAFYFDPLSTTELYQRLIDLLNCDREKVTTMGLIQARKFSWEKKVGQLVSLYMEAF